MAIIAHPDDAEFWFGGTIARWTDDGIQVTYCVLTDGSGGGFDPDIPRPEELEPWTVRDAWLIDSPQREVNHYVDITETFDRKVAAVRAHASQVKDSESLAERLRERITPNTAPSGMPQGSWLRHSK